MGTGDGYSRRFDAILEDFRDKERCALCPHNNRLLLNMEQVILKRIFLADET